MVTDSTTSIYNLVPLSAMAAKCLWICFNGSSRGESFFRFPFVLELRNQNRISEYMTFNLIKGYNMNEQIKINLDLCFNYSQRFVGAVNGVLVLGIIASFTALVSVASGGLEWDALLKANFAAVPMSIPIFALSFVYQNVVPVLCTNLEGDMSKVRTAIFLATAIPLGLFLVWNGVILGYISNSDQMIDPLQQLQSSNGVVGPIVEVFSLLAIATSYIGFILGLSDFLADCEFSFTIDLT
ncbi:LOW QUALITY PROTEIN: tryptophan-specific transport protein-like [Hibiscus syriacus]|uniref:LOW QUALITY PROTEIN: tryptophan-specific transport protein-like n=1 Tax=Hibiscus syriacus TaxID=106335 RepID=UPI0019230562|nr:LOW QUALITY PROTEIN: tryptophan-specific transport protein-like [Hibiscus syriacus]